MRLLKYSRKGLVVIFFVGVHLFCVSCNHDESENRVSSDSKMKSLVVSKEYRELSTNIREFGSQIRLNFSKLSDVDKQKVTNTLNEIRKRTNSEKELILLFERLSLIMDLDFNAFYSEMNDMIVEMKLCNEKNNISDKEFAIAINKYSVVPRLRKGTETDVDCLEACERSLILCQLSGQSPNSACLADHAYCCAHC